MKTWMLRIDLSSNAFQQFLPTEHGANSHTDGKPTLQLPAPLIFAISLVPTIYLSCSVFHRIFDEETKKRYCIPIKLLCRSVNVGALGNGSSTRFVLAPVRVRIGGLKRSWVSLMTVCINRWTYWSYETIRRGKMGQNRSIYNQDEKSRDIRKIEQTTLSSHLHTLSSDLE